jgi:hypothetical protein
MATYTSKARLPSQGKTVCDFRPLTLGSMQIFGTRGPMVPKIGIHFNTRNPVCSYCPARETNWHTNVLNIFFCSLDMFLQKTYKAWPPNSTFLGVKIDIQNLWYPIFGTRGKYRTCTSWARRVRFSVRNRTSFCFLRLPQYNRLAALGHKSKCWLFMFTSKWE